MKTELEEAGQNYAEEVCNGQFPIEYTRQQVVNHTKNDFIEGAKYQAERMYSEEEVEKMIRAAYTFGEKDFKHFGAFKEWFEQFKKK
jgi:hypothetical protein